MKIFSKKETILQNMALMGLMSAVNIIIAVLTAVFPFVGLFLILLLPLTSVVTELFCKDRYYPIYALATIGLSLVATLWNIDTTLFYVIPSIITGYIFGFFCKKNIPYVWSILVGSLIQFGLMFLFIPIVDAICQISMFEAFKNLFKISDASFANLLFPILIFVGSLVQTVLSYIVISGEIKKFEIVSSNSIKSRLAYEILVLFLCICIYGIMFLSISAAYILLLIVIYLSVIIVLDYINDKNYKSLAFFSIGLVLLIIVFACLFNVMPQYTGFTLISVFPFWIGVYSLIDTIVKLKGAKR